MMVDHVSERGGEVQSIYDSGDCSRGAGPGTMGVEAGSGMVMGGSADVGWLMCSGADPVTGSVRGGRVGRVVGIDSGVGMGGSGMRIGKAGSGVSAGAGRVGAGAEAPKM